ncbi:MAG: baseplate hub protein, partial [Blastocatellia bacterium]
MKTHLAQSVTYLAHLFRVEERPREVVIHWANASAANVIHRGGYLKKNGGVDGTEDAAALSISSFDGDFYVRMTTRLDGTVYFGLATSNMTAAGSSINFAIRVDSAGQVRVYESGVLKATHGTAARPGDHLRVQRVGTTVAYWLNRTQAYTSATSSSGALYCDTSIAHRNATVNEAVFGFVPTAVLVTDHTRKLIYNGENYKPLPLLPTRFNRGDGLKPDNAELTHILSSGGVSEADIIGGRWDFARYE